ncbi:hypothetical protein ACGFMK_34920 [Amycolatopsis sp. NPDC049252]|uniref:hypothetical protein n=1 Tax=Amycolatopsis sp. NPDC049252 TaxID=3363933 RepID=UPI00371DD202
MDTSIEAIRGIFACSPDREMLESVRAPLTPERFWRNLIHAVGRSSLRYDHDPRQAYRCS